MIHGSRNPTQSPAGVPCSAGRNVNLDVRCGGLDRSNIYLCQHMIRVHRHALLKLVFSFLFSFWFGLTADCVEKMCTKGVQQREFVAVYLKISQQSSRANFWVE